MTRKWWGNGTKRPMRNSKTSTSWFWQAAALLLCKTNLFPHARSSCKNETVHHKTKLCFQKFSSLTTPFLKIQPICFKCWTIYLPNAILVMVMQVTNIFQSLLIAKGSNNIPTVGFRLLENTDPVSSLLNVWKPRTSNPDFFQFEAFAL